MRITKASAEAIKYACLKFHYSKSAPSNSLAAYNIYNQHDEWCGVILFGSGSNHHIGVQYGLLQGEIVELTRVALNGKQETTSKAVAMCLRQLHHDLPLCKLVVSYADTEHFHTGIIYQATNWIYVGMSKQNEKDCAIYIKGVLTHGRTISAMVKKYKNEDNLSRLELIQKYIDKNAIEHIAKGKHKYLYPLDTSIRKKVQKLALPYPK